ncbi:MAG: SAM-dependent methyltransferase [Anaerolineales bacterium]|nr:SAM-dependent methyltransferase [Anaerolineales bacterium]
MLLSPCRSNSIGATVIWVFSIKANVLTVSTRDVFNDIKVLDLKPPS